MIAGQLLIQKKDYAKAREYYVKGLEINKKSSAQLWICYINLEENKKISIHETIARIKRKLYREFNSNDTRIKYGMNNSIIERFIN